MSFLFSRPRRTLKRRRKSAEEVLEKLQAYLDANSFAAIEMLCGFWKDQQDAITYQELRDAVIAGVLTEEIFELWSQDYSVLVTERLNDVWQKAMEAGSRSPKILQGLPFEFNMYEPGVVKWIGERGAEFITSIAAAQKKAVQSLLAQKIVEHHTTDELARLIRPCIGLTDGQVKANVKYYDSIIQSLKKDHPKMKPESIRRKALEASTKYAERQHRQRAATIAQTEMAFAYNHGADEGIRQAQAENLLGAVKKRWSTSGDDSVCDICRGLEGMEISMDEEFDFKGRRLFAGQKLMPPAHPRCACAIGYIEVSPPVFSNVPQMEVSITESDSFKTYTDKEIQSIAEQTEAAISKHISIPSKWSGNMVITEAGIDDGNGHIVHYGKLWNCDIATRNETAPGIILHEQLHARSASHYPTEVYLKYFIIEEASVQLLASEICMKEGIEVIESGYDEKVDALKRIRVYLGIDKTDFDFAKELLEIPLPDRLNWLSDRLYATMRTNTRFTVADYVKVSKLLDSLY